MDQAIRAEHDGHLPVTRAEFRPVRDSVHRIEVALIGENPMLPNPDALVGKVDAIEHRVASAEASIREAKWGYRVAVAGLIAIALQRLFGGH